MITIKGKVPAAIAKQLETKVATFAKENPSLSTHDSVEFTIKGEDGKASQLKGAFSRGPLGEVVFVLLSWAGNELANVLRARLRVGSKEKRTNRRAARVASRVADVADKMPDTAEERFEYFTKLNMLKKHGKGFVMSGGLKFPDRDAVLAHLAEVGDAGNGGTEPKSAKEAKDAIAKKGAAKAATPKKAAPKKAAKKK